MDYSLSPVFVLTQYYDDDEGAMQQLNCDAIELDTLKKRFYAEIYKFMPDEFFENLISGPTSILKKFCFTYSVSHANIYKEARVRNIKTNIFGSTEREKEFINDYTSSHFSVTHYSNKYNVEAYHLRQYIKKHELKHPEFDYSVEYQSYAEFLSKYNLDISYYKQKQKHLDAGLKIKVKTATHDVTEVLTKIVRKYLWTGFLKASQFYRIRLSYMRIEFERIIADSIKYDLTFSETHILVRQWNPKFNLHYKTYLTAMAGKVFGTFMSLRIMKEILFKYKNVTYFRMVINRTKINHRVALNELLLSDSFCKIMSNDISNVVQLTKDKVIELYTKQRTLDTISKHTNMNFAQIYEILAEASYIDRKYTNRYIAFVLLLTGLDLDQVMGKLKVSDKLLSILKNNDKYVETLNRIRATKKKFMLAYAIRHPESQEYKNIIDFMHTKKVNTIASTMYLLRKELCKASEIFSDPTFIAPDKYMLSIRNHNGMKKLTKEFEADYYSGNFTYLELCHRHNIYPALITKAIQSKQLHGMRTEEFTNIVKQSKRSLLTTTILANEVNLKELNARDDTLKGQGFRDLSDPELEDMNSIANEEMPSMDDLISDEVNDLYLHI